MSNENKTKLANKIELAMIVSKDFEASPAIRKVSDKLTVVRASYGSKNEGYVSMQVKCFGTTEYEPGIEIKPGAKITVEGWMGVDSYEKDGKKITLPVINARKISKSPEIEKSAPADGGNVFPGSAAPANTAPSAFAADDAGANPWG